VRDFSREPIRRVPDRTNRVYAGGALYVSSDVLAWLNKLPPSPPRNAGVKFYPISINGYDPKGARYAKLVKVQASAMTTLAKLGLVEDLDTPESTAVEAAAPVEEITEAPAIETTSCAICGTPAVGGYCSVRRCMNHMWTAEELEAYPEEYRALNAPIVPVAVAKQSTPHVKRERRNTSSSPRSETDAIRRAFCAWLVGRAYFQEDTGEGRGTYLLRSKRTGEGKPAPWASIVERTYPDRAQFITAAEAFRTPNNARTIARHG
jgi:hypothetical protein